MAVNDWRKREIVKAISDGHDSASEYLDKISNTVEALYDKPSGNLGKQVKKLSDIITYFMAALPGDMNDIWEKARAVREKVISVKPTAHRSREFGFGSLTLEVEEETDYMIGEEQNGMMLSSRKLTDEESSVFFRDGGLKDKKLIVTDADDSTEQEEEETVKIQFPGLEYDEGGNLVKREDK